MTKIRFPERFSEKCREVEVCGEAFFEVAENKRVPFVVTNIPEPEHTILPSGIIIYIHVLDLHAPGHPIQHELFIRP